MSTIREDHARGRANENKGTKAGTGPKMIISSRDQVKKFPLKWGRPGGGVTVPINARTGLNKTRERGWKETCLGSTAVCQNGGISKHGVSTR